MLSVETLCGNLILHLETTQASLRAELDKEEEKPGNALRGGRLAAGSAAQAARAIGHQGGHAGAPLASAERPASP